MPPRISSYVGDLRCFLTFIDMITIDCKITNFYLYTVLVCFIYFKKVPKMEIFVLKK